MLRKVNDWTRKSTVELVSRQVCSSGTTKRQAFTQKCNFYPYEVICYTVAKHGRGKKINTSNASVVSSESDDKKSLDTRKCLDVLTTKHSTLS